MTRLIRTAPFHRAARFHHAARFRHLAGLLTILLGAAIGRAIAAPSPIAAGLAATIPLRLSSGTVSLAARICRPATPTPGRLVVINHGAPRDAAGRAAMQPWGCDSEPARWFVDQGDVVVFPLRRGYGATGGPWAEDFGPCGHPDYRRAGLEGARDIDAVVAYATALPYVRPRGAVVIGQSAGGWATIAYDALPHPRVDALINFAGGRGSHRGGRKNCNCDPQALIAAAAGFGRAARTPMLWIYAGNDSYFPPALVQAMQTAFVDAGGSARLIQAPAFANEGHRLFFGPHGTRIWAPAVTAYLRSAQASSAP